MTKLPIGIQLYSLRDFAEKDFKGTLKAVKEMGYDCVEFAGLYGNTPEDVKAICEELGLDPISAHLTVDVCDENVANVVSDYAKIGCKFVAVPYANENVQLPGASFPADLPELSPGPEHRLYGAHRPEMRVSALFSQAPFRLPE